MTEEERFDIEQVADKNPVSIFRKWSSEYMKHNDYPLPVVLATSTLSVLVITFMTFLQEFNFNRKNKFLNQFFQGRSSFVKSGFVEKF